MEGDTNSGGGGQLKMLMGGTGLDGGGLCLDGGGVPPTIYNPVWPSCKVLDWHYNELSALYLHLKIFQILENLLRQSIIKIL